MHRVFKKCSVHSSLETVAKGEKLWLSNLRVSKVEQMGDPGQRLASRDRYQLPKSS